MSSSKPVTQYGRLDQLSSAQTGKQKKSKNAKEVVLHHATASLPTEDWVLYPEEIIIVKHSTLRDVRTRKSRQVSQPDRLKKPSLMFKEIKADFKEDYDKEASKSHARCISSSAESASKDDPNPSSKENFGEARLPPQPRLSQFLPTPDLSDVDEESFWSCCGSSNESA